MFQSDFSKAMSYAKQIKAQGAEPGTAAHALIPGHSGSQTGRRAPSIGNNLALSVALDMAYDGHVSRANARAMKASAGLRVADIRGPDLLRGLVQKAQPADDDEPAPRCRPQTEATPTRASGTRAPAADGAARPRRSDAARGAAAPLYSAVGARRQPAALGREPLPSRDAPRVPAHADPPGPRAGAHLRLAGPRRRACRQPAPPPAADRPRPEADPRPRPRAGALLQVPGRRHRQARAPGHPPRPVRRPLPRPREDHARRPGEQGDPRARRLRQAAQADERPKGAAARAGLAPAIWALNQVSRPVYGVAGGADAAVRGKGIGGIAKGGPRASR
jgi:hypothetical protein